MLEYLTELLTNSVNRLLVTIAYFDNRNELVTNSVIRLLVITTFVILVLEILGILCIQCI